MPIIDPNILVGNDSDEYGCKGSAGYSWCENKSRCIRPFEENCTMIDLNQSSNISLQLNESVWNDYVMNRTKT